MDPSKASFVIIKCVETDGTVSVEVAHRCWIEGTTDGTIHCWWPPGNFKAKAKKGLLPDKSGGESGWTRWEVWIIGRRATYDEANELAQEAQYTSNLESEGEYERKRKAETQATPQSRQQRYSNSAENLEAPATPPTPRYPQMNSVSPHPLLPTSNSGSSRGSKTKSSEKSASPRTPNAQMLNSTNPRRLLATPNSGSSRRTPTAAEPTPHCSNQVTPQRGIVALTTPDVPHEAEASAGSATSEVFQLNTTTRLLTVMAQQRQILATLSGMAARARPDDDDDFEVVAAESVPELEALFQKIRDDPTFRKKLRGYLSTLGGRGLNDTLRRMLRMTANTRLWGRYNVKGINRKNSKVEKKSFMETPLFKVFLKILIKEFKQTEIEKALGDVLKQYKMEADAAAGEQGEPNEDEGRDTEEDSD